MKLQLTENNVEEVINSYNLHEVLANDLRKAVNSEDHPTITTFLPKIFLHLEYLLEEQQIILIMVIKCREHFGG